MLHQPGLHGAFEPHKLVAIGHDNPWRETFRGPMDVATHRGFGLVQDDGQLFGCQQIQGGRQGRVVHLYSIVVHHRAGKWYHFAIVNILIHALAVVIGSLPLGLQQRAFEVGDSTPKLDRRVAHFNGAIFERWWVDVQYFCMFSANEFKDDSALVC